MKEKKKSMKARLREWSKAVRARDNYTCQVCGITQDQLLATGKKSYLNAHHLIEKMCIGELRYDVNIGITLCPGCHKWNKKSAHNNACWFANWLKDHKPEQYLFVMNHSA
jgi:5-methylcytosine-specific restriction endonuclease McrA